MTPLRRGALPSPAGWTATEEYCKGEGYVYNDGKCNCASGFSPVEYDGKKLCKQDKQLTDCTGVEVKASGIAGPTTCYTDTKDLSIVQTLYNACVSGFLRKQFSDSPRILTSCINEGHGSTLELLHDAMFEDACNKIGGFPDGANAAVTGNNYCTYCNAPNMEFDSTTGCVCKAGYTDADGNITNGCEAEQ